MEGQVPGTTVHDVPGTEIFKRSTPTAAWLMLALVAVTAVVAVAWGPEAGVILLAVELFAIGLVRLVLGDRSSFRVRSRFADVLTCCALAAALLFLALGIPDLGA